MTLTPVCQISLGCVAGLNVMDVVAGHSILDIKRPLGGTGSTLFTYTPLLLHSFSTVVFLLSELATYHQFLKCSALCQRLLEIGS